MKSSRREERNEGVGYGEVLKIEGETRADARQRNEARTLEGQRRRADGRELYRPAQKGGVPQEGAALLEDFMSGGSTVG